MYLRLNRFKDAAATLEVKQKSPDVEVDALLALAYSEFDLKMATVISSRLPGPGLDSENSTPDVELLESGKEFLLEPKHRSQLVAKRTSRKKRRGKLPKDPNAKPDPERWLPLAERSYNQRRKGAKVKTAGSQGMSLAGSGLGGTGSSKGILPADSVEPTQDSKSPSGNTSGKKKSKKSRRK